jgi:hypothetical protein
VGLVTEKRRFWQQTTKILIKSESRKTFFTLFVTRKRKKCLLFFHLNVSFFHGIADINKFRHSQNLKTKWTYN